MFKRLINAIRLHRANRAYTRAFWAQHAYQTMPAGQGWSHPVAWALQMRLEHASTRLALAISLESL